MSLNPALPPSGPHLDPIWIPSGPQLDPSWTPSGPPNGPHLDSPMDGKTEQKCSVFNGFLQFQEWQFLFTGMAIPVYRNSNSCLQE